MVSVRIEGVSVLPALAGAMAGIQDCTLQAGEGEILVLAGLPNSGQSTLLRTVNGLVRPVRGNVIVQHEGRAFDVGALRARKLHFLRSNLVSMVFRRPCLLPWRTVAENAGLGLEIAGADKAQCRAVVMEQLELFGLSQWADQPVNTLPGSVQQAIGLARAFATGAPLLLMDAPFSTLDPLTRRHLQDALLALQQRLRKTVIFVSHDVEEAIRMGGHVAVMHDGRIVQSGMPKDIVLSPADEHVAEFVRPVNPLLFLTAADVMRPYDRATAHQAVSAMARATTPVNDLVQAIQRAPGNIGIVENGAIVGVVSTEDIITHLDLQKRH